MDNEQTINYAIKLDIFEGPLDLLLYLIKKNEIDIYNIPVALVTEQYLQYLKMIKALNLDLAGEYLVMASTLIHIKSRMLLPVPEEPEAEEEDPRAELVRQLIEHKTFKEAAVNLGERPLLERDVFTRAALLPEEVEKATADEEELMEVSVFELIEAFHRIVSQSDKKELMEDTWFGLGRTATRDGRGSVWSWQAGVADDGPRRSSARACPTGAATRRRPRQGRGRRAKPPRRAARSRR